MNAIQHFPSSVDIQPASFIDGDALIELFNLKVIYKRGGCPQSILHVHVPRSLQGALLDESILCFHMQEIARNSRAHRVLENSADHVVIAVRLRNEVENIEIPRAWLISQRRVFTIGAVSATAAAIALLANIGVVANLGAACVLAYGLQCLKSVKAMRVRPFQCHEAYGDLSFFSSSSSERGSPETALERFENVDVFNECPSTDRESSV